MKTSSLRFPRCRLGFSTLCLGGLLLLAGACNPSETSYLPLNDADNCLDVEVRPGEASDAARIDVTDRAGARVIGFMTVDPGAAPVNTPQRFQLEITESGVAQITDRVVLSTDNNFADRTDGGIGPMDFVMNAVPGLDGGYDAELASGGEDGEERTDSFCVHVQRIDEEE